MDTSLVRGKIHVHPEASCRDVYGWTYWILNYISIHLSLLFGLWRDLNRTKCRCPVDICLPPAGRRQLLDSLKFLSRRPVRQLSWSDGRQIASPTPKKKSGRQIAAPTQKRWEPGGSKVYHILQKIPRVCTRGIIFRFILTDRPLRPGALPWSGCTRLRPSSRRACPGGRLDADPGPPAPGS